MKEKSRRSLLESGTNKRGVLPRGFWQNPASRPGKAHILQELPSKKNFFEVPDRSLSEVCQKFVRVRPLSETTSQGLDFVIFHCLPAPMLEIG